MINKIETKRFDSLYPKYQDFETKVIARVKGMHATLPAYLDDTKLVYSLETVYKMLFNRYSRFFARNDDDKQNDLMVNALQELLPALYLKSMKLSADALNKLSIDEILSNIQRSYNEDPENNFASTEVTYTSTPNGEGAGTFAIANPKDKNITNRKDKTVRIREFKNLLDKYKVLGDIDASGLVNAFCNDFTMSSLWVLTDFEIVQIVEGKDGSFPWLTDNYADLIEFGNTASENTIVRYNINPDGSNNSQGIVLLAKTAGGIKYFWTADEAKEYIANQITLLQQQIDINFNDITKNSNEITQLKRKGTYKGTYDTVDKINALNGITGDSAVLKTAKDGGGFTYIEYIYDLDGNGTWVETGSESDAHPAVQVEHKLKYILKDASYVAPADPNGIGSINVESVEFKDIIENQMVELEIDMKALKPIDNSQVYIITDADKGEFLRLAFKNGDVASWDEVKDNIYDHNMLVEKVGQYVFIRGWLLKGKTGVVEEYTIDEAKAKDWIGYIGKTIDIVYQKNGREYTSKYHRIYLANHFGFKTRSESFSHNGKTVFLTAYRFEIYNGNLIYDNMTSTFDIGNGNPTTTFTNETISKTPIKIIVHNY